MKVEPRFLSGQGPEIFTGNELLIKGALETAGGVHLLGGYPGSPVAGFFDSLALIKDLLNEKGIRAIINNNEALAAAMLNGTQTIGCRAMIVMKSVGVHVAADALALGSLAGAHSDGGAIVVYGDDPWSDSTQVPADSRYISKHLFIPVFDPANAQEVKDFVDLAFKVSAASELYAGFIMPTNLADGGGTVQCRPNQFPQFNACQKRWLETATINLDKHVLLPPRTWTREEKYGPRFRRAIATAAEIGLNRLTPGSEAQSPIGFVATGLAHDYLLQALADLGVLGQMPILKYGMSYPLDPAPLAELGRMCKRIVVVEERRGFVEQQIGEILIAARQAGQDWANVELWGKQFPASLRGIPDIRGLHPSMLVELLAPLLRQVAPTTVAVGASPSAMQQELDRIASTGQADVGKLLLRSPSFCPGCPHRDSATVCLDIKKHFMDSRYMHRVHHRGPVDLLFHGDTGCYTMLMFPPNNPLMHDYSGMGLGGGTGAGTDPFVINKEVVFMGDSTFFHSGQIAISQAVKLGQDITFIILDNSTTAMTGHQPTPGVDYDVLGNPTAVQDIEEIIRAIGQGNLVTRADPEQKEGYRQLLERTFLSDGVKVIIATKECGITRTRRRKRSQREIIRQRGFLPRWEHMNVNLEACRFCLACAEQTGCPGLRHVSTDYGLKMDTDITWCVDDGACERVGACSAFEHVVIKRKRAPRSRVPELGLDQIPDPAIKPFDGIWRACLTGVGGMGLGVATSILVRAGHKEGYPVVFLDKKGLAIRNGGTVSQVVYNVSGRPLTAVIPYGQADLLIGVDILEAARAMDPRGRSRIASPDKTTAVVNTDKIGTIGSLMGKGDFDVDALEKVIRAATRPQDYLARNISRICEKYLGSKLYANIMMLGFAFQRGLIPVSMHSMAWAIKDTIHTDFRKNLYAFNMGRKLCLDPSLFQGAARRTGWRDTLEDKCRDVIRRYADGQRLTEQLRSSVAEAVAATPRLTGADHRDLAIRAYDCLRWGGLELVGQYLQAIEATYSRDSIDYNYAATRAVLANLAAVMLIKDGVFLAELATSPDKYARDREKYNVNPANGDSIDYRHLWRINWKIGPTQIRFRWVVRQWQLSLLKRMQFLRRMLPQWHGREKAFLRQYQALVAAFAYADDEQYQRQLAVLSSPQCMDCLNPRCRDAGCPLGSRIPEWVELADQKRWAEAADLLQQTNNFPEFTSRICPAPCQIACKQTMPVQIRCIEQQIIDEAFAAGLVKPRRAAVRTGKSVAVVGSGPAGLAAAQQLARAGHEVTVFEKQPAVGGLLRYGIPAARLDKSLIDRRIAQLQAEGRQLPHEHRRQRRTSRPPSFASSSTPSCWPSGPSSHET